MKILLNTLCPLSMILLASETKDVNIMDIIMISMKEPALLERKPGEHNGVHYDAIVTQYDYYPAPKFTKDIDLATHMLVVETITEEHNTAKKATGVSLTVSRNDLSNYVVASEIERSPNVEPSKIIDFGAHCTSEKFGYMFMSTDSVHELCETIGIPYPVPSTI